MTRGTRNACGYASGVDGANSQAQKDPGVFQLAYRGWTSATLEAYCDRTHELKRFNRRSS
jgi:hypothetical protein